MEKQKLYIKEILKLAICFGCHFISQTLCLGATYYVDATHGNDNYNGLSTYSAWKSVAKVNSSTFYPGDSVLFKKGEVWREQLMVSGSGNSYAPITFASYGTGEKPEINSADIITEWNLYHKNIYVADVGFEVTHLFVDGNKQIRARWPNRGWLNIDADSQNRISLYSESLIQPYNYWAGANIILKTQPYWIEVRKVVTNTMYRITWDYDVEYGNPLRNYGFYLEGKVGEIDIPGEWCYDSGKVYLMFAEGDNPDNHLIEGSVRDCGIQLSDKANILIEGITIKYSGTYGIDVIYPNHIYVRNNSILLSEEGIRVYSPGSPYDHISINGNLINHTTGRGIGVWGSNYCEIKNNELVDIASDEISPKTGTAILVGDCTNLVISENRIERVSYHGIFADANSAVVSSNIISDCLLLLGDGGGIYTAGNRTDFHITNNIVSNVVGNLEGTPIPESKGTGVGIYLDEIASGYMVTGNIIYDCDLGIQLHRAYNNMINNNSLYNNNIGIWLQEKYPNEMYGNNFYNNIILCADSNQKTWHELANPDSDRGMGQYNYNLHYNPYRENVIVYEKADNIQRYTLEAWRIFVGQETNSIWLDPLFLNVDNHSFYLKSISPCIDAGVDVGLREDFNGIEVPQGTAPDIGAYEYFSSDVLK